MFEIDSWLIRDLVSKPNFLALQRGDDKLQIRSREEWDLVVGPVHWNLLGIGLADGGGGVGGDGDYRGWSLKGLEDAGEAVMIYMKENRR